MDRPHDDMSEEEADRLTWKIIQESGLPFSIDAEGRLHFDLEALDREMTQPDEGSDDEAD